VQQTNICNTANCVNFQILTGPKLPKSLFGHQMVTSPDGQGVIIIGGNFVDTSIYKLICNELDCKWSEMEQNLQIGRYKHVAMMIPDNLTTCIRT
jgi:hypothetical protein